MPSPHEDILFAQHRSYSVVIARPQTYHGAAQQRLAADETSLALGFAAEAWYVGQTGQMALSTDEYSLSNLDEESLRRVEQSSFHLFAEGMCSDARGQIYNLLPLARISLPHDRWPNHLFIVLVVRGELEALVRERTLHLRPLSQLVILPGVPSTLSTTSASTIEVISFLSAPPRSGP